MESSSMSAVWFISSPTSRTWRGPCLGARGGAVGSFWGGVEREQVGLFGDLFDQSEDLADALGAVAEGEGALRDRFDGLLHLLHGLAGVLSGGRDSAGVLGDRAGGGGGLVARGGGLGGGGGV